MVCPPRPALRMLAGKATPAQEKEGKHGTHGAGEGEPAGPEGTRWDLCVPRPGAEQISAETPHLQELVPEEREHFAA